MEIRRSAPLAVILLISLVPAMLTALSGADDDLRVALVDSDTQKYPGMFSVVEGKLRDQYTSGIDIVWSNLSLNTSGMDRDTNMVYTRHLARDYLGHVGLEAIREETGATLVMIITGTDLVEPRVDRLVGLSSSERGATVVSTFWLSQPHRDMTVIDALHERVGLVAAHEFGHLLGHTHTADDSLMQSYPQGSDVLDGGRDLSSVDRMEYSIRGPVARAAYSGQVEDEGVLSDGMPSMLSLNMSFAFVLMPLVLVLALCIIPVSRFVPAVDDSVRWVLVGTTVILGWAMLLFTNYVFALVAMDVALVSYVFLLRGLSGWKDDDGPATTRRIMNTGISFLVAFFLGFLTIFMNSLFSTGSMLLLDGTVSLLTISNMIVTVIIGFPYLLVWIRDPGRVIDVGRGTIIVGGLFAISSLVAWLAGEASYIIPVLLVALSIHWFLRNEVDRDLWNGPGMYGSPSQNESGL